MTNVNFSLCIGLSKCNFKILASTNGCKTTLSKNTYERLVGNIFLQDFNSFFDNYKSKNILANEALLALEHFIPTLNEFFDLCDGLTEEMAKDTKINWYSYTNISSSGDYIRAKSKYYGGPSFSDVSINMSEEESEDYNTHEGAYFGKVFYLTNFTLINNI
jgi:hypothetical protein